MKVPTFIIALIIVFTSLSAEAIKNPIEVGNVRWGRDLEAAFRDSANSGKPVLLLFQEVPG